MEASASLMVKGKRRRKISRNEVKAEGGVEVVGMILPQPLPTPEKTPTSPENPISLVTTPGSHLNGKRTGRPRVGKDITKARLARALIKAYGVVATAAKDLKTTQPNLSQRISRDPDLQKVLNDARERVKDEVEFNYIKEVIKDPELIGEEKERALNWQKRKFYLKSKLKDRGYGEDNKPSSEERPINIIVMKAEDVKMEEKEAKEIEFEEVQ